MSGWTIVVPVKDLTRAKSRLLPPAGVDRAELAKAMAQDTITAATACALVDEVWVVTDDDFTVDTAGPARLNRLRGAPAGLNPALLHAAAVVRAVHLAALTGDLPALVPGELGEALERAGRHRFAVVPDAAGTGTTLLAAYDSQTFAPSFGTGSLNAHVGAGAVPVEAGLRLRSDVDTAEDLRAAALLGLGPATAVLLARRASA